jgi:hypothetical protein
MVSLEQTVGNIVKQGSGGLFDDTTSISIENTKEEYIITP